MKEMPSQVGRMMPYVETALHVIVILVLAWITTILVRRLTGAIEQYAVKRMRLRPDASAIDLEKNVRTINLVLSRSLAFVIWAGASLAILRRLGVDTSPILTGAGVVGLAMGFGSQSLIKDVIAGLFLLIENQIRVGDTATINGVTGSVSEVNLRTVVLRSENGALHYFPNGSITALANLSIEFSIYILELVVAHETSLERAFQVISETGAEMQKEDPFRTTMLTPVEIQGVDRFTEPGLVLRIRIKTTPGNHYTAGRELNRRLVERFRQDGVELAARAVTVRSDAKLLESVSREDIREIVREVLADTASAPPPASAGTPPRP